CCRLGPGVQRTGPPDQPGPPLEIVEELNAPQEFNSRCSIWHEAATLLECRSREGIGPGPSDAPISRSSRRVWTAPAAAAMIADWAGGMQAENRRPHTRARREA